MFVTNKKNMQAFPQLVCCGGSPYQCQNFQNVAQCPSGLSPQFCCTPGGSIVPATVTQDQFGNVYTVCPNYGSVPYSSYDPSACQQAPLYSCCNNNYCYQSKDSGCSYWGTTNSPSVGGMYVPDCSQCGPTVSCCWPGDAICQVNDAKTGCPDPMSSVVSDCSQCQDTGF